MTPRSYQRAATAGVSLVMVNPSFGHRANILRVDMRLPSRFDLPVGDANRVARWAARHPSQSHGSGPWSATGSARALTVLVLVAGCGRSLRWSPDRPR